MLACGITLSVILAASALWFILGRRAYRIYENCARRITKARWNRVDCLDDRDCSDCGFFLRSHMHVFKKPRLASQYPPVDKCDLYQIAVRD